MLKYSFNADSANIQGISQLAMGSLAMFYNTPESKEGKEAFLKNVQLISTNSVGK